MSELTNTCFKNSKNVTTSSVNDLQIQAMSHSVLRAVHVKSVEEYSKIKTAVLIYFP
jgi:hypothetical protein